MSELVDVFLKHKGFIKEKGGTNAPIMPNILADSVYLCWYDYLNGKLNHGAKKHCGRMMQCYRRFNKEFFSTFNETQTSVCVDAMNDFSNFTENETALFKLAVKNRLKGIKRENAEMISHIAYCKFLTAQANDIWGIIYRRKYGEKDRDNNLYGMYVAAREMLLHYTRENTPKEYQCVDLSNDRDIQLSMKRFEARVMEFIKNWK